mmetsp:Transcript_24367/g.67754  ORF Transcript_24367/g.67754 Transcript_24367/m.67754 type:complete len:775 (-) Transcript_24367:180-2504(-)
MGGNTSFERLSGADFCFHGRGGRDAMVAEGLAECFTRLLAPADAFYAKRFGLPELLSEVLMALIRLAPENPAELFLELAAQAAEDLHKRALALLGPQHYSESELIALLNALCDDPATARTIARNLLVKSGIAAPVGENNALVSWTAISTMLQGLEAAWGVTRDDTQDITKELKRRALQQVTRSSTMDSPALAQSRPQIETTSRGIKASDFVQLFPWAVTKLRQRHRRPSGHGTPAAFSRQHFLRKTLGQNLSASYEVMNEVGGGASGTVALCVHRLTGQSRAVKTVPKGDPSEHQEVGALAREFEVLKTLDHPHIVRVYEVLEDEYAVHIAMELVFGGTLKDAMQSRLASKSRSHLLNSFGGGDASPAEGVLQGASPKGGTLSPDDELWVADVTRQLLDAVNYAHSRGVVHKDLKPQNVLLAAGAAAGASAFVVVCDFGIAELAEQGSNAQGKRFHNFGGTPHYIAPEVWQNDFNEKADLWSVGVILYEMLSGGRLPFTAKTSFALYRLIASNDTQPDFSVIENEAGRELCCGLLQKSEALRIDAGDAATQCNTWFRALEQSQGVVENAGSFCSLPREITTMVGEMGRRSHLDHCVMACVASQLSATSLNHINAAFARYDTDRSGVLGRQEMTQVFADIGISGSQADVVLNALDGDGNGEIDYSEFLAGCLDMRREQVVQQLKMVFMIFDHDHSGYLSREELEMWLAPKMDGAADSDAQKLMPDGATLDEVMGELDTSGDGKISYEEFRAYLMRDLVDPTRSVHLQRRGLTPHA